MTDARSDARADRRLMLTATSVLGLLFAVATTTQSVMALGVFSISLRGLESSPVAEFLARGLVNVGSVGLLLLLMRALSPERRSPGGRAAVVVAIAVTTGVARASGQLLAGVYSVTDLTALAAEIGTTTLAAAVTMAIALSLVTTWRRQRDVERQGLRSKTAALDAHHDLRVEELRVRREVAQEIHGTVQGSLVILEAQVHDIAGEVPPASRERLAVLAEEIRAVREEQLRDLTTRLFPAELDRGLGPAIAAIVARLPPSVAVDDRFSDGAARLDARTDVSDDAALLLVRIVEEGVTNALRHGRATRILIALTERADAAVVEVADDGAGLAPGAPHSGLERLHRQLALRGGALALRAASTTGASLTATIPLHDGLAS